MRKFGRPGRHWTPRYVVDRVNVLVYEETHRTMPWLNAQANHILDGMLRKNDVALEWGSGRSTRWIAAHVGQLTSVEHDRAWYDDVTKELAQTGITNVKYEYRSGPPESDDARATDYVRIADSFAAGSLDFVLVDGSARDYCAESALDKVKVGGVLVVDDSQWFFDYPTRAPFSRQGKGPSTEAWSAVWDVLRHWRIIWTTNGKKDTAIFVRPMDA
jgi:hypothetical protein